MTKQEFQRLLESLAQTPEAVRQIVKDLRKDDQSRKPSSTEFSGLEHICHLRDIEQEGYSVRIEKLLNEHKPFLPDIDGDKLAKERNYNSQNLDSAICAFARARESNVRAIENLTSDQLSHSGTFENVGPITLETLLLMMQEHDQSHIKDLNNLRNQLCEGSQSPSPSQDCRRMRSELGADYK